MKLTKKEREEREKVKPIFWFAMWMLFMCVYIIIYYN